MNLGVKMTTELNELEFTKITYDSYYNYQNLAVMNLLLGSIEHLFTSSMKKEYQRFILGTNIRLKKFLLRRF